MLTAALSITLVLVAAPAFMQMREHGQAISAANLLITQLQLARITAVNRRTDTLLCPSRDGRRCGGHADWNHGWLTFLDRDRSGQPDSPSNSIIASAGPVTQTLRLQGSTGRPRVRYLPDGRSPGTNLTISICNNKGALLNQVIINNSGRVRSQRPQKPTQCAG